MKYIAIALAALAITACSPPASFHKVQVDGEDIRVIKRQDGSWSATAGQIRVYQPTSIMPKYVKAVEKVSGCKVDPTGIIMSPAGADMVTTC